MQNPLESSDREQHPLVLSYRFRRQWNRLAPDAQVAVGKVLTKLRQGSCRMKALSAYPGLYEIRISNSLRLIVERPFSDEGTIVRSVGDHGPILRRP
jgi:hypothetical protein